MKARSQGEAWKLVFSDEFNQKNGSRPNAKYWSCSPRGWSTWNRWISDSKSVAFIKNGKLVCRAIPNTENPADTARMLTGAVETRNKFAFQYGKIEVRAKTNLHIGNFPAIWLLPQPPAERHPFGGEIDIVETFGTHKDAYQSVYSHWIMSHRNTPPKHQFLQTYIDVSNWHVYGLIWTDKSLTFTIDGQVKGFYPKSEEKEELDNKQWPFDHPFYIILNQSVRTFGTPFGGDPDINYTYETLFDWVRVYQKKSVR